MTEPATRLMNSALQRRLRAIVAGLAAEYDVVVTMGCGDACPVHPGPR